MRSGRRIRDAATTIVLAASLACAADTGPEAEIRIDTITRADLPTLDPNHTYEFVDATASDPVAVLRDLLARGIPLERAWLPRDDRCLDPLGPRLTIELARPEPAVLELGFRQGTGRLACATTLTRYVVIG